MANARKSNLSSPNSATAIKQQQISAMSPRISHTFTRLNPDSSSHRIVGISCSLLASVQNLKSRSRLFQISSLHNHVDFFEIPSINNLTLLANI
ncbi:predicted protein [Sclerotinia sclerotiorum 1980 UF-70]|uniref:Uncharacterized protein n=1 Tax=Sclerotinia sclerotiorum (strain ATCC 18683 / 1980 / Ss-1) TaxID=665079 RepID=A7F812_SCLS1|nr:predicted protein [Sclerotinia sclerotiorum 1980 UF-70]EDN98883.1 predicted protein [Sclerotinia sclerotiorum 1980 UF-70]